MSNKSSPAVATMGIDIGKNSFHVIGPIIRQIEEISCNARPDHTSGHFRRRFPHIGQLRPETRHLADVPRTVGLLRTCLPQVCRLSPAPRRRRRAVDGRVPETALHQLQRQFEAAVDAAIDAP
jgi:hypothetical protein